MVSKNMICPNKKCRYEFFEREEGYVSCPSCGQEIKENMPTNPARRSEAIVKMLAFQRFLKAENTLGKISIVLLCIVGIIIFLFYDRIKLNDHFNYSRSLSRVVLKVFSLIPLALVLIFFQAQNRYKYVKKLVGEMAWYCSTFPYKLIKWLVYVLLLFLLFQTLIPNLYSYYLEKFLLQGMSRVRLEEDRAYFYAVLGWTSLYMFMVDLFDIYRRKLSKQLDRRYFK